MSIPAFTYPEKENVLRAVSSNARAYTPEWRFDPDHPDLGGALALIYTELFTQTLKRFGRVPEKNMAAFFNSMGLRLLPALPAEGFVRFGLAGQVTEGTRVPAGTPLLADADNDVGSTTFETTDDVLVTPAEPEELYTACGAKDAVIRSWTRTEEEQQESFRLFDLQGENLQTHVLALSQDQLLQISGGASIEVELVPGHQKELPRSIGKALTDPTKAVWEYSHGESWQTVSSVALEGNRIVLKLGSRQLPITPLEREGWECKRWLRLRLLPGTRVPEFSLRLLRLSASNSGLLPDQVHADGSDQDVHEFYPFGQQLGVFDEAYFSCQEALVKRGARVEMTFNLDFASVPLDFDPTTAPVNWKLIMKKSDFQVDQEYDITVREVLWEYFNGTGWARLFPDSRESDCFNASSATTLGQRRTISFTVPEDMEPVLVNADVGYFIRARVLQVNNLYKLRGNYIVPVMEGLRFAYHYDSRGRLPEQIRTENNLSCTLLDGSSFRGGGDEFTPFAFLEESRAALYFGFETPPAGGPIKILFLMEDSLRNQPGRLRWEFYTRRGWKSLNVVDETEQFRQTGILTMMGGEDFDRAELWGRELYWVRAIDEENYYGEAEGRTELPRVDRICMNASRVRNVATQPEERFSIASEQKNFSAALLQGRVVQAEVWVNELETLLPDELDELERQHRLRAVRDQAGVLQEAWVLWEEREDFALSAGEDRHYVLDRNGGVLRFSDGVNGRIPPSGDQETILVQYLTGGGSEGNVPAGAINRSSLTLGFVSLIENPRPTAGGCDQETVEQAMARGGSALRHGGRAVTARDFESLALEATRNIARARCFSNLDAHGAKRNGYVTMVVLLREYEAGGELLSSVCRQVRQYVLERCGGNLQALHHFLVIPPQFLELRVKALLNVRSFQQVFDVQEAVEQRLTEFLNPITGNFDGEGWPVGTIPNLTQLRNCLTGVMGEAVLRSISATAFLENGATEVELDDLGELPFVLPKSGKHTILITVE